MLRAPPVLAPPAVPWLPAAERPAAGSGSAAVTWNPPSGSGPALNVPPQRCTRSRMPMIPCPVPAAATLTEGNAAGRPPSSVTRMTRSESV